MKRFLSLNDREKRKIVYVWTQNYFTEYGNFQNVLSKRVFIDRIYKCYEMGV